MKRVFAAVLLLCNACWAQSACSASGAPTGVYTFGDSITTGAGVADPSTQGYVALMTPTFTSLVNNYAVSGYLAVDMTVNSGGVYPNLPCNPGHPVTMLIGTNDAHENGTGTNIEAIYSLSYQADIALMAVPCASLKKGQACTQTSGTWTADNTVVSGMGIMSGSAGAVLTCTVTFTGPVAYIAYRVWNSGGGSMTVKIDGSTPAGCASLSSTPAVPIVSGFGTDNSIFLARCTGVSAGSHAVAFTATGQNTIMWVGGPAAPSTSRYRVYAGGVVPQQNNTEGTATAAYNADAKAAILQLVADGLPVDWVDVRSYINSDHDFNGGTVTPPPLTAYSISTCTASTIQPEHPGTCGHGHLALAFDTYYAIDAAANCVLMGNGTTAGNGTIIN